MKTVRALRRTQLLFHQLPYQFVAMAAWQGLLVIQSLSQQVVPRLGLQGRRRCLRHRRRHGRAVLCTALALALAIVYYLYLAELSIGLPT